MTYAPKLEKELTNRHPWLSTGSDVPYMLDTIVVGPQTDKRRMLIRFTGEPDKRRYDLFFLPTGQIKLPRELDVQDCDHGQMMAAVLNQFK